MSKCLIFETGFFYTVKSPWILPPDGFHLNKVTVVCGVSIGH